MPQTVLRLIESADRALDHDSTPMKDWDFIQSYIKGELFLKFLSCFGKVPCLGPYLYRTLYHDLSLTYDMIVNFVEAHHRAYKQMYSYVQEDVVSQRLLEEINVESEKQIHLAIKYRSKFLDAPFPEIVKSI